VIPDPLIGAFAHDPLAVGVYVAIARLALIAKAAVPLAAWDLVAWMGSEREADRAAVMRRIVKLEQGGWVIVARAPAAKHRLLPTWGRDQTAQVRPWRFDDVGRGRPQHLRGRRLPLAVFDCYLGRLDPQWQHGRALISRYFTRPLLDLTDIGVYTIGLRAEIRPTPRLRHLGLHSDTGMLPPPHTHSLLSAASVGALTTLEGDRVVPVHLSLQGQTHLGAERARSVGSDTLDDLRRCGSLDGSADGSRDGSSKRSGDDVTFAGQNGLRDVSSAVPSQIAWDGGMLHESTNHDSAPLPGLGAGGGSAEPDRLSVEQHRATHGPFLAGCVVEGHRALNPSRQIPVGEWLELRALLDTHGAEQVLVWQARATRAEARRPHGITPAYYRACAARAVVDICRPSAAHGTHHPKSGEPATVRTSLEPACDSMLRTMGVRERQKLASVPRELIAAWQAALNHPGLAAQFTSPVGFAVRQMQRGNAPPPMAELDHWAERARRAIDRYETWRHVESPSSTAVAAAYEQQLEARVRALAPPDADLAELCALAGWIEAGATDGAALARLYDERAGRQ
jgi:hypothetical protein